MSRNRLIQFVLERMIWFILLLVIAFFAWRVGLQSYLAPTNLINILIHASVLGVLTIGQTICLLTGNFDLSAEGTMSFVIVLAAWLMLPYREMTLAQAGGVGWELNPLIVVPLMLVVGLTIGLINGTLISRLNMNNFIVTLSMQLILRGLAMVLSMGAIMPGTPAMFNWLGGGRIGMIPISVIFTLALYTLFAYILRSTRFGRELYAVGGNRDAAACIRLQSQAADHLRLYVERPPGSPGRLDAAGQIGSVRVHARHRYDLGDGRLGGHRRRGDERRCRHHVGRLLRCAAALGGRQRSQLDGRGSLLGEWHPRPDYSGSLVY